MKEYIEREAAVNALVKIICEYRGITHWRRDGYDPWFSAKGSSVTITHWMPLPEPPKEET